MEFRQILFYITIFIHLLFNIFIVFAPYLSNDPTYLLGVIVFYVLALTLGYILGCCFITYIEHMLDKEQVPDYKVSYTQMQLGKLLDDPIVANMVFRYTFLINICITIVKIVIQYKNNIISTYQIETNLV